jgi:hypothetical protein
MAGLLDRGNRFVHVGKGQHSISDDLAGFMSFASNHEDIARL